MSCYKYGGLIVDENLEGEEASSPIVNNYETFTQKWPNESGTALVWSQNSGKIPSDIDGRFELIRDGDILEYPAEFTIDQSTVATLGYATINLNFATPGAYYWARAIFINGV